MRRLQSDVLLNNVDPATAQAARDFLRAIEATFPVTGAFVFGSRARGNHKPESDADLAVLLTGQPSSTVATIMRMTDAAYRVELEHGIVISPLPVWQTQWDDPASFSNPDLLRRIKRDGIAV